MALTHDQIDHLIGEFKGLLETHAAELQAQHYDAPTAIGEMEAARGGLAAETARQLHLKEALLIQIDRVQKAELEYYLQTQAAIGDAAQALGEDSAAGRAFQELRERSRQEEQVVPAASAGV